MIFIYSGRASEIEQTNIFEYIHIKLEHVTLRKNFFKTLSMYFDIAYAEYYYTMLSFN